MRLIYRMCRSSEPHLGLIGRKDSFSLQDGVPCVSIVDQIMDVGRKAPWACLRAWAGRQGVTQAAKVACPVSG